MKKFELGEMQELSGSGRCVECIENTEEFVAFKEYDGETIKCSKSTESRFNGKDVEEWEAANYGEYHIRAIV